MKKYDLGGKWRMTGGGYDVEGVVPGSVYSFLCLDNKLLPDPYYRDNEDIYTALMEHEYTFERQFCYAYDDKQTDAPISLVFEGLDTLCTVFTGHGNGQIYLLCSSQFLIGSQSVHIFPSDHLKILLEVMWCIFIFYFVIIQLFPANCNPDCPVTVTF